MTLLDRYLLKQFAKNLGMVLAALIAIYLLVDLFERLDNFIEAKKPFSLAVKYFFLKIPAIVDQLMPVCILLAGIITLGILSHHHELIALKAGGIHLIRITVPIIGAGLLCTGLVTAMAQWLLPATMATTNRIWYEEVQHQIPKGIYRNGSFYYRGSQGFYSFVNPYMKNHDYSRFTYAGWDGTYRLDTLLSAEKAVWENGRWNFENGQIKTRKPGGGYEIKVFDRLTLGLPDNPTDFFVPEYKKTERSISQLFARANNPARRDDPEAWQEFNSRLSYIFLGLPLLLLGLPMLIIVHQKWGRDLSLAIPASCGLAFAAWAWWGALQSMAQTTNLHPVPAAWTVHILVGGAGAYLLKRQNR